MYILLSNNSETPIYEQIEEQIKLLILRGELKAGEALPSMRMLAKDLRVSIITTKRAYEELERGGFIDTVTGRGSFVKPISHDAVRERISYEIELLFDQVVVKARYGGQTWEELVEMFHTCYENTGEGEQEGSK